MQRWVKVGAIAIGLLLVTGAIAVGLGLFLGEQRAQRRLVLDVKPVAYRSDAAALEQGQHLFVSRGCTECHGDNGGGRTLVDDGKGTHLAGPNITPGNPALLAYREVDWVRSIRHGVAPSGRPLRLMPSEDYNRLSDEDLGALVAHLRHLQPVQGRLQGIVELPLPARVLYGFGVIPDAADRIDHSLAPSPSATPARDATYGRYVAQMCIGCHGADFSGGKIPGAPPDWPAAARLAPGDGSAMPRYPDAASFAQMLKTGKRPDGSAIAVMPFDSLGKLNEVEVAALFSFLKHPQAARQPAPG